MTSQLIFKTSSYQNLSSLLHTLNISYYYYYLKKIKQGTSTFHTILNMEHSKQILTYTSSTSAFIYMYFIISFTVHTETSEGNQKSAVRYRNYFCLDLGLNSLYDAFKCGDSLVPLSITFMYIYSLLYPSLTSN